ncbi:hypothetical protein AAHC03_025891 [Spirometra sp. Aus1]
MFGWSSVRLDKPETDVLASTVFCVRYFFEDRRAKNCRQIPAVCQYTCNHVITSLVTSLYLPFRWSRLLAALLMLLVSPPALLVLAFLLNPLISQFPPPPTENVTSVSIQLGKVLLQTYLEADLLGSWSWNLATRILLPLWLFTWNGLLVSD